MKKEIMAYVTALTDVYSGTINQPMIKALNDILNFVEDIPTEQKVADFKIEIENRKIKALNKMLETICDNLVEKNCELIKENQVIKNRKSEFINKSIQVNKKLRRKSRIK